VLIFFLNNGEKTKIHSVGQMQGFLCYSTLYAYYVQRLNRRLRILNNVFPRESPAGESDL